jgi:hypothetical protein
MGLIWRLFERVLVGTCLGSMNLVLLALAGLLRFLPQLFHLARSCLRGILILSFRLYRLIVTRLAPTVWDALGVDVRDGFPRVVACALLSLVLGTILLFLVRGGITGWGVGMCLVHGLAVALAWDEIEAPGGLQLGTKLQ